MCKFLIDLKSVLSIHTLSARETAEIPAVDIWRELNEFNESELGLR